MALNAKPSLHHSVSILKHVVALINFGTGQDMNGIGRLDDSTPAAVDRYDSAVGGPGVGLQRCGLRLHT